MRNTIIDLIGQTPLVKLRINDENREAAVYAKLEMQNPYGMKDRVAKQMILEAKRTGLLEEGAPIVEFLWYSCNGNSNGWNIFRT